MKRGNRFFPNGRRAEARSAATPEIEAEALRDERGVVRPKTDSGDAAGESGHEAANGSADDGSADDGSDDDGSDDDGSATDGRARRARRFRRTVIEWVAVIVGGVAIALVIETFLVQAFWIPSESMTPTLEVHDRVLVNKLSYRFGDVDRGDVVVFRRPPNASTGAEDEVNDLIKRVVAIEGDTLEARDGRVVVNGEFIDEPYLADNTPTDNLPFQTVPEGHVFVMGDNRTDSEDSRVFGPIDEDRIVGRAFLRVLPLSNIGWL